MKVNITLDTSRLSIPEVAKIAAKVDCGCRCDCNDCVFYTNESLIHDDMETHCISIYLSSKLNVNKL